MRPAERPILARLFLSRFMSRPIVRDTRHISLARALHGRLYVNCEGVVFAVGGRVAHDKLLAALARQHRCPTVAESPTPHDLGVAACDGELSDNLLHGIGRALNRWRIELAAEMKRKPARRRNAQALACERREIERLNSRLAGLRTLRSDLAGGSDPAGAPFFLDAAAEASLQTALDHAQRVQPLSPLVAWQARVVYWLSGECAARRFLAAAEALLAAYPNVSLRERLRGFQQAVIVLKQRSEHEPVRHLVSELAALIRRLPSDLVLQGRYSSRLRGRTFSEHCDLLLERCSLHLLERQQHRCGRIPAELAALAAADGSAAAIPHRILQAAAEQEDLARLSRIIGKLAEQIGQPGYDALLAALEQLPDVPSEHQYGELRQLLAKGVSPADCVWACEQNLLHCLQDSDLSVRGIRRLSALFSERGCPPAAEQLDRLARRIRRNEHLRPIHAWLAWIGSVSPRAVPPRMQQLLWTAFWDRYLPSVCDHGWFEELAPVLAPVRRKSDSSNCKPLLDRIAVHQRLAGRASLPKSVRKLLDARHRRQRERESLRARQASGDLDAGALARLTRLESEKAAPPGDAKIRRAAEEAFLMLGIETLGAVTRSLAETKCRTHLGGLAAELDRDQFWDFANWIQAMNDAERERLHNVIAARDRHGCDYKRYLPENASWIRETLVRGIDLDPWFAGEPYIEPIGGMTMETELAGDLLPIFLMGDYFHTCLGLGDCNQMSVLANACDANKQVVFMFADDDAGRRRVAARQLIAISSEFKLVGYCCYVNPQFARTHYHQNVVDAVASYCGRLAARCGLELADQGSPETIGDHFWYDDGEGKWPAAARTAWKACSREAEALTT
jgi:hypothetical protein